MVAFYNAGDQELYKKYQYIPQEQYRLGLNLPTDAPAPVTNQGIVATNAFTGGGGGAFDPYNIDMSTIRQDYNAFPSRQAGEIYSKTFNPQSTFDPNLIRAQNTASLIRSYESGTGPGIMRLGNTVFDASKFSPEQRASILKSADNFIDDARMQYATEGQFVDPYDPNYSSMTEAQKFMDNYPEYYGVNEKGVQLPGILGAGLEFLKRKMPINERAIMENEARGAGVFTDDIGRIVTDDYNTAGGIMAGYNLSKVDAGTFDKRRSTIENTLGSKYGLTAGQIKAAKNDPNYTGPGKNLVDRLGLLDESEEDILGARKKTELIYKMKKDKKTADTTGTDTTDTTDTKNNNQNQGGDGAFDPSGPTQASIREEREDKSGRGQSGGFTNPGKGSYGPHMANGGRAGYFYGGRVNFKYGGLASIL
tara:strand:+ start:7643 stop:8905 length:1263 start_codon:yes stop_codon:yes gene_type:complete